MKNILRSAVASLLKRWTKTYNTWKKASNVFVEPSFRVYFGPWRKDPHGIQSGKGPVICFYRNYSKVDRVRKGVPIKVDDHRYEWTDHELPKGLKPWDTVWKSPIRRKLRKWHLGWIPPCITLPRWCNFRIVNFDVAWKSKWGDTRYEFPPQFSIVLFGISLTFTLHCPVKGELCCDDFYWEAIIDYPYYKGNNKLQQTIKNCGIWRMGYGTDAQRSYFSIRPEYITPEFQDIYYATVSEIKAERQEVIE